MNSIFVMLGLAVLFLQSFPARASGAGCEGLREKHRIAISKEKACLREACKRQLRNSPIIRYCYNEPSCLYSDETRHALERAGCALSAPASDEGEAEEELP